MKPRAAAPASTSGESTTFLLLAYEDTTTTNSRTKLVQQVPVTRRTDLEDDHVDDDEDSLLPEAVRSYYYPNFDVTDAARTLKCHPPGTFLLRRSRSPNAAYTLSIRGEEGVFNVRVFKDDRRHYQLDASCCLGNRRFGSIYDMIGYFSQTSTILKATQMKEADGGNGTVVERIALKLKYPLCNNGSSLMMNEKHDNSTSNNGLAAAGDGGSGESDPSGLCCANNAPVGTASTRRRAHGGSLKAMVNWL